MDKTSQHRSSPTTAMAYENLSRGSVTLFKLKAASAALNQAVGPKRRQMYGRRRFVDRLTEDSYLPSGGKRVGRDERDVAGDGEIVELLRRPLVVVHR